jgi:hypothetical protein
MTKFNKIEHYGFYTANDYFTRLKAEWDKKIWYKGEDYPLCNLCGIFSIWGDIYNSDKECDYIHIAKYDVYDSLSIRRLSDNESFCCVYNKTSDTDFCTRKFLNDKLKLTNIYNDIEEFIKSTYGEDNKFLEFNQNGGTYYPTPSYVLPKEKFKELYELLFGFFTYFKDKYGLTDDKSFEDFFTSMPTKREFNKQVRTSSKFFEKLFTVMASDYINYTFDKVYTVKKEENKKLEIYGCYHDKDIEKFLNETYGNVNWVYGPDLLLNNQLSEFSMWFDLWNFDKISSPYVCLCHYRRIMQESDFSENEVNENSCKVFKLNPIKWDVTKLADTSNQHWISEDMVEYVSEKYGKESKYYKYYTEGNNSDWLMHATLFLTKERFMDMCDFMFGFVDYIDNKYNLEYNPSKYEEFFTSKEYTPFYGFKANLYHGSRYVSYLLEVLVSDYIQLNGMNYTPKIILDK